MRLPPCRKYKLTTLLLVSLLMPACNDTNIRRVVQAVNVFHERFNAGQFREIYRNAGSQFRASISEADFIAKLDGLRRKHGAIRKSNINGLEGKTRFQRYFPNYAKTRFIGFYNHCENDGFQEFFSWDVSGAEVTLLSYETNIATLNRSHPQQ